MIASTARIQIDCHDNASPDDVSCCSVVPAWMATNEGGATPTNSKRDKYTVILKNFTLIFPITQSNTN